jgi:beta-carotene hydroxylase
MRLRHSADVKTLFWALVLFPAVPALGLLRPALAPWLLPVGLYLGYCAGVLTHSQNHCPVFLRRGMNQLYAAWLSVFYGYPSFAWIPTHNQNHHRYLNGPGDATRTTRMPGGDSLWSALVYPLRSAVWQAEGIQRYLTETRARDSSRFVELCSQYAAVLVGHGAVLTLAIALHGWPVGLRTYVLVMALPALFASWSMMFTNYVQHVDCDPTSPDNHSRNFVSPLQNWFVFDAGFHTVHHEKPGAHWSELRRLHAARAARIDPSLNQHSIVGFVAKRYLLGGGRRSAARV